MILYYSGTGNSRYVAERIATIVNDKTININQRIKNNDYQPVNNVDRLIIVTPTYAWRIPRIVKEWILKTEFKAANVWFVMTCGSEIGNAAKYNMQLCREKHFTYMGTAQIIMPENYIAMFNAPKWDEADYIIDNAEPFIRRAGELIRDSRKFDPPRNTFPDRIMSSVVNPVFYTFFVKANGFRVNDSCTGCGKCASLCPLNNVVLKDKKPVWGRKCTHCMACICYCPQEAIEYGKKSIGQPRYQCKK